MKPNHELPSIDQLPLTPTLVPLEELDEVCYGLLIRLRDTARARGRGAVLEMATFTLLVSFEAMVLATLGDPDLIGATAELLARHYQTVLQQFRAEFPELFPDSGSAEPEPSLQWV
jgi:hypothetical protein